MIRPRDMLVWLPFLTLTVGCPAARTPARAKPPPPSAAVIVVSPTGERPAQLDELLEAMRAHAQLQELQPRAAPAQKDQAKAIRARVKQAGELYLTMRMESARAELLRALKLIRRSRARGLNPRELAEIHLLLAAVSHAQRRPRSMGRYCKAAAGYDPELPPNPDLISPPVREAFEKARGERQSMEVVVQTEPTGAQVTWDGVDRGPSPATIPDQFKGEHYLVVEHPLYRAWDERIVLSTSAELQVKLEPADPPRLLAAAAAHPELAARATGLLGVDAVVWPEQTPKGMGLRVVSAAGERALLLAPASPPTVVQTTARTIARKSVALSAAPRSQPQSQPTSQPAGAGDKPPPKQPEGRLARHFRDYWWAYAFVGATVVGTAIALPLALHDDEVQGRGAVLEIP